MNASAKFDLVAAAVLAIAVAWFALFGQRHSDDEALTAPTPPPSTSAETSATPSVVELPVGALERGTYRTIRGIGPFTLTVPDGWVGGPDEFVVRKAGPIPERAVKLVVRWVPNVYGDSCKWQDSLRDTSTIEALVEALAAQGGHDTVGPERVTLNGRPATRFEFSVPAEFDASVCDNERFVEPAPSPEDAPRPGMWLWPDGGSNMPGGMRIEPAEIITVFVVDVDGAKQVVCAIRWKESRLDDVEELQGVVDSLEFER